MSIDLPVAEQVSDTTAVSSLSWWQVWKKALFQPSVATYEDLANDPNATLRRAFLWVFLCTVIGSAINMVLELWSETALVAGATTYLTLFVFVPVFAMLIGLLVVLGYVIGIGVINWFARKLGGTGTYTELAFASSAFIAPLALIPYVPYLNVLLSIYVIVYSVIAIKAVHKFGWGNAIGALIVSGASLSLVIILVAGFFMFFFMLLTGLLALVNP